VKAMSSEVNNGNRRGVFAVKKKHFKKQHIRTTKKGKRDGEEGAILTANKGTIVLTDQQKVGLR